MLNEEIDMQTSLCWRKAALVTLTIALLGLGLPASAHETADTGDDKTFEKNLDVGLRAVINQGAALFNEQGDFAGCYRLYEGALVSLRPLLGKYPDVQKAIDKGIQAASVLPKMHDRAHTLRKVIDEVRFTLNPDERPVVKTLWDKLGGEVGVTKVIGDVLVTASKDPKVNFTRDGKYPLDKQKVADLQKSLIDFVSQATGGPLKYTGLSMKDAHKGMGITDAEFNALGGHLKAALEKNGVKAENVKAVLALIETTRKDIVEPVLKKKVSLWDKLGGESTLTKVIDEFVKTAKDDPEVNFDRGGKVKLDEAGLAMFKKKLLHFLSYATGGPHKYDGKDMKEAHKGMGITEKEFNATAGHLKRALEKFKAEPADVATVLKAFADLRSSIVEPKKEVEDKKIIDAPDPNMAVLSGHVTIGGNPLNYGFVTFVDKDGRKFSANIQKDGKYVFNKGFMPGTYKVLIEDSPTPPEKGEKRVPIPMVFQSLDTTPGLVEAEKGKQTVDFKLK
jgi:hemoglobin